MKSIKLKNTYLDNSSIAFGRYNLKEIMTIYDDTEAEDIRELLRKKIDIAKPYLNGSSLTVIITGGWRGHDFGFTIVNRARANSEIYTAVAFFSNMAYLCRLHTNSYVYSQFLISEEDSNWQNLTLADGITVGTLKKTAQYRKVAKTVQLRGDVAGITKENTLIATLPIGYRPTTRIDSIQPLNGMRYCRYRIEPSGQIILEWISDKNYNATWHNLDISFMVS